MHQNYRNTGKIRLGINKLLIALLVMTAPICHGQNTGPATAKGNCIVANTGPNSRITQNCLVVPPELFKQFQAIAKGTQSNTKLLMDVVAQLQTISDRIQNSEKNETNIAPNGMIITGGTNTNPTVNNYGAPHPPPRVQWSAKAIDPVVPPATSSLVPNLEGEFAKNPGVVIHAAIADIFYNPVFVVVCDRPCQMTSAGVTGISSPQLLNSDKPNVVAAAFPDHAQLFPGGDIQLTIRSKDALPISVLRVEPYVQPQH